MAFALFAFLKSFYLLTTFSCSGVNGYLAAIINEVHTRDISTNYRDIVNIGVKHH